jgi:ABC-type transport system involved in multi-copper enzyme maturation permease subunit
MHVLISEWTKLRRRGMYLGLALMAVLGGALSSVLTIVTASQIASAHLDRGNRFRQALTSDMLRAPDGLAKLVAGGATILGVIALILYANSFASEYSQGTIRNLLVREPHRLRLLFGKLAGTAIFVSAGVAGAAVLSIAAAYAFAPGQHIATDAWSFASVGASFGRILLTTLGWGVLGTVLAVIFRSPAPSIGAGVVYILLVDPLINAAWSAGGRWLPGQMLQAIALGGTTESSLIRAALIVVIYMVAILVMATALFVRRDVAT